MNSLLLILLVAAFGTLPLIAIGCFLKSEKSHKFINGREKITDINTYTKIVGNSFIITGIVELCITLVFCTKMIDVIGFGIATSVAAFLPLPYVLYAHKKFATK